VSDLLSELARAKAIFQQRAILAHIGSPLAPPPDASNCPPATNGDTPSVSAEKLTATGDR